LTYDVIIMHTTI